MNLTDILAALRQWLSGVRIPVQVMADSAERLWAVFETENALAELLVREAEFAPCRFVSFAVLDTRLDLNAAQVFCFHDDDSCTIVDILRELDRGLAVFPHDNRRPAGKKSARLCALFIVFVQVDAFTTP